MSEYNTMSGYNAILRIRRLEQAAHGLGFMFSHPRQRFNDQEVDMVALKPLNDDTVPIYSRDAEVFCGTLDQLATWLQGVEWARDYDRMLKISDAKKRALHEDRERHRIAEMRKRESQKKMLEVLKASDHENSRVKK
jgi:hypothetical protein